MLVNIIDDDDDNEEEEEVNSLEQSSSSNQDTDCTKSTALFCLMLPGKRLHLKPLLAMKKFRNKGNKHGAVKAFYYLENEGLGKVIELSGSKGSATVRRIHVHVYICMHAIGIHKEF